jgi:hypothetical protein
MLAVAMVIGVSAILGLVLFGGPLVVDWVRSRREEAVARQISLTDALDGRLGPLVAPVVRRPLWGPWEIRMDVSIPGLGAMDAILPVVDDLFSPDTRPYRIVLVPHDSPDGRWGRKRLAAA